MNACAFIEHGVHCKSDEDRIGGWIACTMWCMLPVEVIAFPAQERQPRTYSVISTQESPGHLETEVEGEKASRTPL
eukprot:1136791-Pelagomonas_calceolata.AAC.5